jgi:2-polyprenyl-6-methoxyphenol hydroxylase-like FAD-dependent oxidoreductase
MPVRARIVPAISSTAPDGRRSSPGRSLSRASITTTGCSLTRSGFPAPGATRTAIPGSRPRRTAGGTATACQAQMAMKTIPGDWWFFTLTRIFPQRDWPRHGKGSISCWRIRRTLGPLLKAKGYRPCGTIRGTPANSQRLRDFCGNAWLAVGDAAQAYDPLSSQGIDKALRTASHAGHMIHYALTDRSQGAAGLGGGNAYIRQYDEQQRQLWQAYLAQREFYYGIQRRWSDQRAIRRHGHPCKASARTHFYTRCPAARGGVR